MYRPQFPSSLVPLFQTEFKCEVFHIKMSSVCSFTFMLDLPQVDCEMRDKESEGRSRESRVDLFRLRNIEFNLHTVGAKKLGVT